MKSIRAIRIYKGYISSLLVFIPFIVATAKLTFFYHGCMDGFGHAIFASFIIVFAGGPLSALCVLAALVEAWRFIPKLDESERIHYAIGHFLALCAIPLAVWITTETVNGNFAVFSFR